MTRPSFHCLAFLLLLIASPAWAGKPPELPLIRQMLVAQQEALEQNLAASMMLRPQTLPEALPRLEAQIDLRLICRWALAQAAAAPSGSDHQAAARLRAQLLLDAADAIEAAIQAQGGKLTPVQSTLLTNLHPTTFRLGELKTLKDLDDISKNVAAVLVSFTAPAGTDATRLPLMRPHPLREPKAPATQAATYAQMDAEARRFNVGVQLRAQLLALFATLSKDSREPAPQGPVAATLTTVLDLARALQSNTAVTPQTRTALENDLAQAIALYADPRTRSLGAKRLTGMHDYRQTVARIARMNLSPEQTAAFSPLFSIAQQNPEQGGKLLSALERGAQAKANFDARARRAAPLPTLRTSIDSLEKQFATANTSFIASAAEMGKTATVNVANLEAKADESQRLVHLLEKLDQMPVTLDTLGAYKPKPGGGLERHLATAAAILSGAAPAAGKPAEAADYINNLHALGQLARDLAAASTLNVSPAVEKRCTGGHLSAAEAKWRSLISDAASSLAAGQELDISTLARARSALDLYAAVRQALQVEAAVAGASALPRWIDWRVAPEDLRPIFTPYQQAMAAAFEGYINDAPSAVEDWNKVEKKYRPLIDLMIHDAIYQDQCAALPTGPLQLAASLATPLDNAPFAPERYLAFCMDACKSSPPSTPELLAALLKRLAD